MFANACREVSASFADIARITACTGKLVDNIRKVQQAQDP